MIGSQSGHAYHQLQPALKEESDTKKPKTNIGKLYQQSRRMMQEAMLDRQWEMTLLKAQLLDAEETVQKLQRQIHPELVCEKSNSSELETWSPSSLLSLRRVCMHCKPGDFVAVVGAVGSGKSTLVNSLLGEGRPLTGTELAYKGKLGAFLQQPFIMNDTVRNNILLGSSGQIDEERYQLAIRVCSLSHDLKLLSAGDQTEIGEKGITLSGGQKARVALARAVYHDASIYLLDDPIAAVDAHVGKALFNSCIVDEMLLGKSKKKDSVSFGSGMGKDRNATVILVTNALQYLNHPEVDKIIVLEDGCVVEVGSYAELSSDPNSKFASYLAVLAETSKVADDESPIEADDDITVDDDARSENCLETADEPEVAKLVEPSPPRKKSLNRKLSSTLNHEVLDKDGALTTDEFKERVIGSVGRDVYLDWAAAAGGISIIVSILALFVFVEGLSVSSKWWLTHWSQEGGSNALFYLGM